MGCRILKKHLRFDPTFFLLIAYILLDGGIAGLLLFVTVVLLHELAHVLVAKKFGYRLESFSLSPYGASLNYKEKIFEAKEELLVAIAGPFVNIMLATVLVSLWWAFPSLYSFTNFFVKESYLFALFNLLPCYPLDGGRVATAILQNIVSRERAIKIVSVLNLVFAGFLFVMFIISCFIDFNPTFALGAIFLVLSLISTNSQSKYKMVSRFDKKLKNFSKCKFVYIKKSTSLAKIASKIDSSKFTIFVITLDGKTLFMDEEKILKLSLKYPLTLSIGEVLNLISRK